MDKKKVLLVDDNPADLLLTETVLEELGFAVTPTQSGKEAIQKCVNQVFDLVIIDMQMPVMTGIELLEKLVKMENTRDVPKLMLSATSGITGVKKAIAIGAHDYLTKPIDSVLLKEKLNVLSGNTGDWKEFNIDPDIDASMGLLTYCRFLSISEISATIVTAFPLREGSVTTVLLKMHGIFDAGLVNARVNEVQKEGKDYKTKINFLGLPEKAKSEIRQFCNRLYADTKQKEAL